MSFARLAATLRFALATAELLAETPGDERHDHLVVAGADVLLFAELGRL